MTFSSQLPVVSVKDASIVQQDKVVLSDVNFEIGKSEFVYLIGRTGSGKSSLLKTLYADLDLHAGSAQVAGFELKNIKRQQVPMLRRKMGIIFQDFQLFADRTVAENLMFVMKATGWTDKSKMKRRVSEVLMKVGLGAVDNKMPHQLSGGEQQRVVIARALINEPALIIADEPTGNLDPEVSEEIMKIFISISHSGTAILMATHNHNFIVTHPGRVLKCDQGRVLDSAKETFAFSNVQ
jgi:cell division transport system ATP-binding protein